MGRPVSNLMCVCCRSCGRPWTLAVVIYTASPSGNDVSLCKVCLDLWLDNADDDPDWEPSELRFLDPMPV